MPKRAKWAPGSRRACGLKLNKRNYDLIDSNLAKLGFRDMTEYLDFCLAQTVNAFNLDNKEQAEATQIP